MPGYIHAPMPITAGDDCNLSFRVRLELIARAARVHLLGSIAHFE